VTDVNAPTETSLQNKLEKYLFCIGILEVTDEKSTWVWIPVPYVF